MSDERGADFGIALRRFRSAAGLSQEALAERARVSAKAVSALERGARRTPYRATVCALEEALDLSPAERGELEAASRRHEFPQRLPLDHGSGVAHTNLPLELTSFVGREIETAEIVRLLEHHRLVTITGSGGVGKTRTAVEIGTMMLHALDHGVWLIELAPLTEGRFISTTIAATLGIDIAPGTEPLRALVAALKGKRLLLILDNCEHLVDDAASIAHTILRNCPHVGILASSRQRLGIVGEEAYRMPSLAMPPASDVSTLTAKDARDYGAIALFVDRAVSVDRHFALTDANAPIVAEIVLRLDGVALAIELAAARLTMLNVQQLKCQLDHRFHVLRGGSRTALPRHKTLRGLLDWSYDLLSMQEQTLLRRVAIFAGGWTLEAAEAVCGNGDLEAGDVLELLASLVDKSLVVAEFAGETTRYRLPESTQAYVLERVVEHDAIAARLAEWVRRFARDVDAVWETTPELAWRERIDLEIGNIRAVLVWSLGRGRDPLLGAEIVAALIHYWRSVRREGRHWLEATYAALGEDAPPEIVARIALGLCWTLPIGHSSIQAAERAVEAFRALDDRRHLAMALLHVACAMRDERGREQHGATVIGEALGLAQDVGCRRLIPLLLGALVDRKRQQGELDEARSLGERALARAREQDDLLGLASALSRLAEVEFNSGDVAAARRYGAEALEVDRRRNVDNAVSADLCDHAAYAIAADDLPEACVHAGVVIAMADRVDQQMQVTIAIEHLAIVAALGGECECAARLLGFTDATLRRLAYCRQPMESAGVERARTCLAAALDEATLLWLNAEGEALENDRAGAEALRIAARGVSPPHDFLKSPFR
jgi:predicted ATPase/DNA-binding XRE family transcriptional regulator